MKKIYLLGIIASAALAMTSCSSDETTEVGGAQNNAIEFGTYLGRDAQVRGIETTTANLDNMGVYASYTVGENNAAATWADDTSKPNFMYNQLVEKSGSAWTYSPLKYWPTTKNHSISFFAYAPQTAKSNSVITTNSENTATGAPTLTVTLPTTDLKKMVDFVAGVQMNKKHSNDASVGNTVKFNLKHELTRLAIKAKVSEDVWKTDGTQNKTMVVITDIQLDPVAEGQFYSSGVYKFATNDSEVGTWTGAAATTALDLSTLYTKTNYTVGTGYNENGFILENSTAKNLFDADHYLFLIPANGATGLTNGKATVTVTYDIVTTDGNLAGGCSVSHAVKTVAIPAGTLKQGTAYTLTITINVDQVKLDAVVNSWDTDDSSVNVPYDANN